MTKYFLEIQYPQDPTDLENGFPPEIIRLVVANETTALDLYNKLDISIKARHHIPFFHECNHSATGNAPCTMKKLAMVEP